MKTWRAGNIAKYHARAAIYGKGLSDWIKPMEA